MCPVCCLIQYTCLLVGLLLFGVSSKRCIKQWYDCPSEPGRNDLNRFSLLSQQTLSNLFLKLSQITKRGGGRLILDLVSWVLKGEKQTKPVKSQVKLLKPAFLRAFHLLLCHQVEIFSFSLCYPYAFNKRYSRPTSG